jgi:hypothetical protein
MKPENILYKTIDETKDLYEFKLCDFNLVDETISKNDISKNKKGTDIYMGKDKRNTYDNDVHVYDQELNEIRDLANVMYFLYFGEVYKETDNKIKKIEDNDFYYLLKNTLATSSDFDRMSVDEYFKNYFFYKNKFSDGTTDKKHFKLNDNDAYEIANITTKIKNPKQLDYKNNIITKISKDIEHFTSYIKDNIFYFVGYNNKEKQIEIYNEAKEKYVENKIYETIKISDKKQKVNDILIYQNFILLLSSPIYYINIKNNFDKKYIDKNNLFIKFISNENVKLFIYLNETYEIKSFEIEIKNDEFYIKNEKSIINIEKPDKEIKGFDCFKTSKNDILIYLFTNNLIQIYDYYNKQLIYDINYQKKSSINFKSLLLTEFDNEINVIYLTSNENNTKQLINIIKFGNENYKDKLIRLTENDNKNIEMFPHPVNSIMEKIKLLDNTTLIIKCPANIQYYDLKEKIFTAYSKYGTNLIVDIKPCEHNFYGKCVLGLRYYNQNQKIVNIFYLTEYSDDFYKLKSFVIKTLNNEFFNETSIEYVYHINHLDSREIRLIDRLLYLNKEEKEVYKLIEKKRKKDFF